MAIRLHISPRLIAFFASYFRYFLALVAVIVLVVGYVLVIEPRWQQIRTTGISDLEREQERFAERAAYRKDLEDLQERYLAVKAQYAEDIAKLSQILPSEADIPSLIVQVDALARNGGLSLDSVSVSTESVGPEGQAGSTGAAAPPRDSRAGLRTVQVSLELSAGQTYGQFKQFLRTMEEHIRLFDLIAINYAPAASGAAESGEKYSANFKTYYAAKAL